MKRILIATLIAVGAATGILAAPAPAQAQFFFGGFFRPRNNVVVVNNNNGFASNSVVSVRQRGFFFPRNDVTVVNNGGFVSGGVVVNRGFGGTAFVQRRVVVGNAFVVQPAFVNTVNSCGYGGAAVVVRSRVGCY